MADHLPPLPFLLLCNNWLPHLTMLTLTQILASPPLPHHLQHMQSLCLPTLPHDFHNLSCLCSHTSLRFTNLPSLHSQNDWLLNTRQFIFPISHLSTSTNIGFHSTTSTSPLYTILSHSHPVL
ncbi:hypothetical protein O181_094863 [Austropuccinia psidii MF-1]|uniref:Uncharacterized protein n=1 Tax=Austropuccinia psidii MF-1 TaxID=1389203 RepID=A0A9Q3J3Y8_9BASI|nr:hypothetical protein [Austropuccinia psidii MF-1]